VLVVGAVDGGLEGEPPCATGVAAGGGDGDGVGAGTGVGSAAGSGGGVPVAETGAPLFAVATCAMFGSFLRGAIGSRRRHAPLAAPDLRSSPRDF
jgi:hypothetical protein